VATTLRASPYARELLQYIYSCAMPGTLDPITNTPLSDPTMYNATLDPNGFPCAPGDSGVEAGDGGGDGGGDADAACPEGTICSAQGRCAIPCTPPAGGAATNLCAAGDEGDAGGGGGDGGIQCPDGYTCSAQGTCVVPLCGSVGLGINSDGTAWWGEAADGTFPDGGSAVPASPDGGFTDAASPDGGAGLYGWCDESCQRWVSACVLARTNAYGVHVSISMRAPADAQQSIKNALAVTPAEREGGAGSPAYDQREGAYYGNLFMTQPDPLTSGAIDAAPEFFACAGPDSSIPEITKRFCSSQGDQTVIKVPGVCLPDVQGETSLCQGEDTDQSSPTLGAIQDCHTNTTSGTGLCTNYWDPNCYNQVITVYLKTGLRGIPVCGDAVCEDGEDLLSSANYCPSDCHVGTWAKDFTRPNNFVVTQRNTTTGPDVDSVVRAPMFAIAPDNTIVVAAQYAFGRDLGGGPFSDAAAQQGQGRLVVKYNPDQSFVWGSQFGRFGSCTYTTRYHDCDMLENVDGVAVAANGVSTGNIAIVGTGFHFDSAGQQFNSLWISTFDPSGGGAPVGTNGGVPLASLNFSVGFSSLQTTRAAAIDSQGSVVLAATYLGTATFGSCSSPSGSCTGPSTFTLTSTDGYDIAVVKVAPGGNVQWATSLGDHGDDIALSLSVDSSDNVVLATMGNEGGDAFGPARHNLVKLAASNGAALWPHPVDAGLYSVFSVAGVDPRDPNGDVYASGYYGSLQNFGTGPLTVDGLPPFIAKYSGVDGSRLWANPATAVCLGQSHCGDTLTTTETLRRNIEGLNISFDQAGSVVLGSYGNAIVGGGINFGFEILPTYLTDSAFLSAYSPATGALRWAKQVPMVLGSSNLLGVAVDSQDRVVLGGNYSGWMEVDDALLRTPKPADIYNTVDTFLASFNAPSLTDTTPPSVGQAVDETGAVVVTVPKDIFAQATSQAGAAVFYMVPTAMDNDGDGTSVSCSPPPFATFPFGKTPVSCIAYDPQGNHSPPGAATFNVTVVDTIPPLIFGVPDSTTASATGADGAKVTYATPTAVDQIDGNRPVTCAPLSGSVFAVGKTTVTCTASDKSRNQSQATFVVTVLPPVPPSLNCVGTPSSPVVVSTSPGACGIAVSNASGVAGTCSGGGGGLASCTFDGASSETLGPGDHSVSVVGTAEDSGMANCTSYVRVVDDEKPVVTCRNQTVECAGNGGATVTGSATCTDNCSCTASCATAFFRIGTSPARCTATDPSGNSSSCQGPITVVDTKPPSINVSVSPSVLWPPNHKLVAIAITDPAKDGCDSKPTVTCTATSNEPDSGGGSGHTLNDIQWNNGQLYLRAERSGKGSGRIYTISCVATDASGNRATATATVTVPHDR